MMEEIKKINDSNMEKVSGGETCRRCGKSDGHDTVLGMNFEYCNYTLYGQPYCRKCFEILDNLEKQGTYIGNEEYKKKIASLEKEIKDLRKKIQ